MSMNFYEQDIVRKKIMKNTKYRTFHSRLNKLKRSLEVVLTVLQFVPKPIFVSKMIQKNIPEPRDSSKTLL